MTTPQLAIPIEQDKPLHKPHPRPKRDIIAGELEALCRSREFWGREDGKAHEHGLWEEEFFSATD